MTIEEVIGERPYMKDTLRAYEKTLKFRECASGKWKSPIGLQAVNYPRESVDQIFGCFSSFFDLPNDIVSPLREAMQSCRIELTRLPLHETPVISCPYDEDEVASILFLLSKPFFLRLREAYPIDDRYWKEGKCPICNARPSLASVELKAERKLYCSFCETAGPFRRSGCPLCLTTDTKKITILTAEGEEGFRIDTCDGCGSYVKTVEAGLLDELSPDLADIVSMPLDIVAQEKGYRRHSPNPIGLTKMTY